MEISPRNVAVALLTATAVYVGAWATVAPRSWYDEFPGLGRTWVSIDGPYNEHLARDVGAFYLALAVLGVLALMWSDRRTTVLLGAAWSVYSAPHLAYHVAHLDTLETIDAVGQTVSLAVTQLLALWLLVSAARERVEP